jgi:hypothetical protein
MDQCSTCHTFHNKGIARVCPVLPGHFIGETGVSGPLRVTDYYENNNLNHQNVSFMFGN